MKYMGSKSRIADNIVPFIQKIIDENNASVYIEPFCGGCNIIDKIDCRLKIGSDNHRYLIALLNNLDKLSTLPEFVTKEHYSDVRDCFNNDSGKYEDWYVGAIGFLASYNGRFFDGGYAGVINSKAGVIRNYYDEAKRNLINQAPNLKNIIFCLLDYRNYNNTLYKDCVFYLDPPYKNKKQYGSSKNFNHDEFWNWCRKLSQNNIVIISEQEAPLDFECVWEQKVQRTIDNTKRVNAVEKLFMYKGGSAKNV